MWNMKCMVIPVISRATGTVTKGLGKNFEAIPGKHSIDSLQMSATLGTSHIIREVLQSETWSLSGGDRRWLKRRSASEKRPVTKGIIIIIKKANADSVSNLIRQWNTSHQHAQYWQKNNTQIKMMQCVLNCTVTYASK